MCCKKGTPKLWLGCADYNVDQFTEMVMIQSAVERKVWQDGRTARKTQTPIEQAV